MVVVHLIAEEPVRVTEHPPAPERLCLRCPSGLVRDLRQVGPEPIEPGHRASRVNVSKLGSKCKRDHIKGRVRVADDLREGRHLRHQQILHRRPHERYDAPRGRIVARGFCADGSYARMMSVTDRVLLPFAEPTYVRDLEGLYEPWAAARAPAPELLVLNDAVAVELGVDPDALRGRDGIDLLLGTGAR